MLYEVPSSKVEALERTTSRHLRKWPEIPSSFSRIGLYWKLQPSLLVAEFTKAKTRLLLTLRNYPNELFRKAESVTSMSRKRSATDSASQTESSLKSTSIVRVTAVGRQDVDATITLEHVTPKREAIHDPVIEQESRRTCLTREGGKDGTTINMDHAEHHRQEVDLERHLEVGAAGTFILPQASLWPPSITSKLPSFGTYIWPLMQFSLSLV